MAVIQLNNIKKEYQLGSQTIPVLHGIDLSIEEGEFVSIMGPSGSGKSTLMNILGCLDRPSEGSYILHNCRVDSLNDNELSQIRNQKIGFVFQSFNLLSDSTALQNISLPLIYRGINRRQRKDNSRTAAEGLKIGHRVHHKPTELSGGQAQRVAIARALIGNPALILADEPTGNLDSKTGKEIIDIFLRLHQEGNTIVMVTHDERLAQVADRIIRISDGKVVKDEKIQIPNTTHKEQEMENNEKFIVGLRWLDLFLISIKEGLLSHPLRTFLTMLGVLFGVAAVIAMIAINEGARQKSIEQIQQMGLHNIRLRSLEMSQEELREARKNLSMGLNIDDLESIQTIPTVKFAVPIRIVNAEISLDGKKPKGRILATTSVYQKVANFYVDRGRFLDNYDNRYFRRVCVLGQSMKKQLFANEEALGKKIYLGSEVFVIVGVMEGKNAPQGVVKAVSAHDLNNNVYIPLSSAKKRFKSTFLANELDEISIMVNNAKQVKPTSALISKMISQRHREVNDFEIVVPEELLRQSRKTQEIFDIVMVCIASISLIVGGIGIMNIMLATVTERIREIGIRRAIGASRRDILKQFLIEALVISMAGGILGVVCGWIFTIVLSASTGWQTVISTLSIILGVGVSTVVGIIFGIYPAWKAALLDPIKALNTL